MTAPARQTLFRAGLLDGTAVALAGRPGEFGAAVGETCAALGAAVVSFEGDPHDEAALEAWIAETTSRRDAIDVLVVDGSGEPEGEHPVPGADAAWVAIRSVANGCFIPDERGGKVVFVSPRPGDRDRVAARAALENMARELSIEWARYAITLTTIAPGASTAGEEVGALVAYLACAAGDYFSGCVLDLGVAEPS